MRAEHEHTNEEHTAEHGKMLQHPLLADSFCREHSPPSRQDVARDLPVLST